MHLIFAVYSQSAVKPVLLLETFQGTMSLGDWIKHFVIADEDEWTSNAKVHLVGKATAAQ